MSEISPIDAISRLTSSTASGGRRLRISDASSWGRVSRRIADFLTPERSAIHLGARGEGRGTREDCLRLPLAPCSWPLSYDLFNHRFTIAAAPSGFSFTMVET